MRVLVSAALAALLVTPVMADETEGLVLAYDRSAGIVVLTDMSVWEMPSGLSIPSDLGAGDRVVLEYETAGEDGLVSIDALTRVAKALPEGSDGGS